MAKLKIKGNEIDVQPIRDSFNRRAQLISNNIVSALKIIGIKEDDIEVSFESMAVKKAKASVTWWAFDHRMHYSYNLQSKYVDNLNVVLKVIEAEIRHLLDEKKTLEEFIAEFREESDVDDQRKEARDVLGLEHHEDDFDIIDKRYKELAKEHHPDMPTGSVEKFKELNNAHKTLKRELK